MVIYKTRLVKPTKVDGAYRLKPSKFSPVRREEVVGLDTIMSDVEDLINYQKNFKRYSEMGAEIPGGVLLNGPKGTGKTLVARYIATASDSCFVNMDKQTCEKGDARDIVSIFEAARTYVKDEGKPVILFKDEFDKRFLKHEYRYGITNNGEELLKILDGVEGREVNRGILLMGTANLPEEALEMPLFRPGRMETLYFYPPIRRDKERLVKLFVGKAIDGRNASAEVDAQALSHLFGKDDSPAVIEALVRDAYFKATKRTIENPQERIKITTEDLYKLIVKRKVKNPTVVDETPEERHNTAIHELGHERVADWLGVYVPFVSVIPNIQSLGQTFLLEKRGKISQDVVRAHISTSQAGYLAEEIFGGEGINFNASSDIEHATSLANNLERLEDYRKKSSGDDKNVTKREGFFPSIGHSIFPSTRALQRLADGFEFVIKSETGKTREDKYADKMLRECEERARKILRKYDKGTMSGLADLLAERKTLFKGDIRRYLKEHGQPIPD